MSTPEPGRVEEAPEDEGGRVKSVVVRLRDRLFAFRADLVREMLLLPPVTRIPKMPAFVRGVMNLRGAIVPVLDLRARMGLPPLRAEVEAGRSVLASVAEDFQAWMAEDHCGVVDPTRDEAARPSKRIEAVFDAHAGRDETLARALRAACDAAVEVERAHPAASPEELAPRMAELQTCASSAAILLVEAAREIAVVVQFDAAIFAIVVDSVTSVEFVRTEESGLVEMRGAAHAAIDALVEAVGLLPATGTLVMILDLGGLSAELGGLSSAPGSNSLEARRPSLAPLNGSRG